MLFITPEELISLSNDLYNSQSSSKEFIKELAMDFEQLMYHAANKYTSDPSACEEIILDSLATLIEQRDFLRTLTRPLLANFIVLTVQNTAVSYVKIPTHGAALTEESPALSSVITIDGKKFTFSDIWASLDGETRRLFENRYILGYDNKQLALVHGCSSDEIRLMISRTRREILSSFTPTSIPQGAT